MERTVATMVEGRMQGEEGQQERKQKDKYKEKEEHMRRKGS